MQTYRVIPDLNTVYFQNSYQPTIKGKYSAREKYDENIMHKEHS
jgi:hypothetical protein